MHDALIPPEQVDDFFIVHAKAFTRKVQRAMVHGALDKEKLPVLEWQVMFSIARFGSCHLAHITKKTSIDPAHGSRAISALEKKGLVTRQEDKENKRRKLISLTSEGVETFERIWPRAQSVLQTVTSHLNQKEFDDLKRLLMLVNSVTDPRQGNAPSTQEKHVSEEDNNIAVRA